MPLLARAVVAEMLSVPPAFCPQCIQLVKRNYCRQCDEFCTDGHVDGCANATHVGHKGYDRFAPTIGDQLAGHVYEAEYGAYRINKDERYR